MRSRTRLHAGAGRAGDESLSRDQFGLCPSDGVASRRPMPAARSTAGKRDDLLDQIGGAGQRLLREMGVALRGARMQMAEQALHHIERHAAVDQEARERMAQVVQADIFKTGALADTVPGKNNEAEGRPVTGDGKM